MNADESHALTDRRQWLATVARNTSLAGIALAVTYLAARPSADGCPKWTSDCRSCQLLSRCEVPLAKSVREEGQS